MAEGRRALFELLLGAIVCVPATLGPLFEQRKSDHSFRAQVKRPRTVPMDHTAIQRFHISLSLGSIVPSLAQIGIAKRFIGPFSGISRYIRATHKRLSFQLRISVCINVLFAYKLPPLLFYSVANYTNPPNALRARIAAQQSEMFASGGTQGGARRRAPQTICLSVCGASERNEMSICLLPLLFRSRVNGRRRERERFMCAEENI